MEIRKVGVVGAGLMGSGIAQVVAMAGFPTVVREVSQALLDKFVEKGALSAEQKSQILGRLKPTLKLGDLAECDLVIEAIIENLDRKKELFAELDRIVRPE